ncbi:imidazole glycerol phosphate synthase subunit HisH [Pelagibacterales bacterium SAG-MED33]|nr:imidazole glycerol phosphate synthase subunit HisH [Pelagibacterales bacterium SAG-MED33]
MIGIIDYGLGNINAISNIYNKLKIQNIIISTPKDFDKSEKFILPGVGAFDSAMTLLKKSNFILEIRRQIFEKNKKILGICVGMQIFAKNSSEGKNSGLNWINADVRKLNSENQNNLRLPHMGWNSIKITNNDLLLSGLEEDEYFYFCHSYYFNCVNQKNILAETNYGHEFPCVIKNDNIYGIQFHPEKSHDSGLKILKNFAQL